MDELQEASPQAVEYFYGAETSIPGLHRIFLASGMATMIEIMNSWIIEERKLLIIDLLHSLWYKDMDLRFRQLQEAKKYNQAAAVVLTPEMDSTTGCCARRVLSSNKTSGNKRVNCKRR